jgi:hypothetical protein
MQKRFVASDAKSNRHELASIEILARVGRVARLGFTN